MSSCGCGRVVAVRSPDRPSHLGTLFDTYPHVENEYGLVCSFNPTFPGGGTGVSGSISKDHFALVSHQSF
jgi:hypothetical protein